MTEQPMSVTGVSQISLSSYLHNQHKNLGELNPTPARSISESRIHNNHETQGEQGT